MVLIVDGSVLFSAALVVLFGWALRRSLSRAERVPWAAIVVRAVVSVTPIVGFALARGLKAAGRARSMSRS
jgi:NhaP-type Na+/H+ or K+/H+ antiporter